MAAPVLSKASIAGMMNHQLLRPALKVAVGSTRRGPPRSVTFDLSRNQVFLLPRKVAGDDTWIEDDEPVFTGDAKQTRPRSCGSFSLDGDLWSHSAPARPTSLRLRPASTSTVTFNGHRPVSLQAEGTHAQVFPSASTKEVLNQVVSMSLPLTTTATATNHEAYLGRPAVPTSLPLITTTNRDACLGRPHQLCFEIPGTGRRPTSSMESAYHLNARDQLWRMSLNRPRRLAVRVRDAASMVSPHIRALDLDGMKQNGVSFPPPCDETNDSLAADISLDSRRSSMHKDSDLPPSVAEVAERANCSGSATSPLACPAGGLPRCGDGGNTTTGHSDTSDDRTPAVPQLLATLSRAHARFRHGRPKDMSLLYNYLSLPPPVPVVYSPSLPRHLRQTFVEQPKALMISGC